MVKKQKVYILNTHDQNSLVALQNLINNNSWFVVSITPMGGGGGTASCYSVVLLEKEE